MLNFIALPSSFSVERNIKCMKVALAIERLRIAAEMSECSYNKPLCLAYSGGKDSDVMLELALRSGIKFEIRHHLTTVDAPQTVYHVRRVFKDLEIKDIKCKIDYPQKSMWELIVHKCTPPSRQIRWCCTEFKENKMNHRMIATGVRWGESVRRKKMRGIYEDMHSNKEKRIVLINDNDNRRRLFERCRIQAKTIVNPIVDFTTDEIWDFYNSECKYRNPLYDLGFKRIGCIGCPMSGKRRLMEFEIFPKYKEMYLRAFGRMLKRREERGLKNKIGWQNGNDVFEWWMK